MRLDLAQQNQHGVAYQCVFFRAFAKYRRRQKLSSSNDSHMDAHPCGFCWKRICEIERNRISELFSPNVNLLRTSRSKRFSAFMAWKLISFCVRVTMIHQLSTIGKLFLTNFTNHALVLVRCHVTLQSCLVVESLAAFRARMILLSWMFPRMLYEWALITTLLSA